MERTCMIFLKKWLHSGSRKPLIIQGAPQVGKTWVVRRVAEEQGKELIEVNFERPGDLTKLFLIKDPKEVLLGLESHLGRRIDPLTSLLFLDEIQALPEVYSNLRWFKEEMPELPVIAVASQLWFALENNRLSAPVGRVSYMYIEPLSFEEFLLAQGHERLVALLKEYTWNDDFSLFFHDMFMDLFKEYIIVGGMPAAVVTWLTTQSLTQVTSVHADILHKYRNEMLKYRGKIALERFEEVIAAVPTLLGEKFVYSKVNEEVQSASLKRALYLLCQSRICHKVRACAADGPPLGGGAGRKFMKVVLIDVGLCSTSRALSFNKVREMQNIANIKNRGIAEQVVGQLLRTIKPEYIEPELFCWIRPEKGARSQIDYILQHKHFAVPLEVKSGTIGSLKSLHVFMAEKGLSLAVRINSDVPRKTDVTIKDHQGNPVNYELRSIPFYLISELHRLLD